MVFDLYDETAEERERIEKLAYVVVTYRVENEDSADKSDGLTTEGTRTWETAKQILCVRMDGKWYCLPRTFHESFLEFYYFSF